MSNLRPIGQPQYNRGSGGNVYNAPVHVNPPNAQKSSASGNTYTYVKNCGELTFDDIPSGGISNIHTILNKHNHYLDNKLVTITIVKTSLIPLPKPTISDCNIQFKMECLSNETQAEYDARIGRAKDLIRAEYDKLTTKDVDMSTGSKYPQNKVTFNNFTATSIRGSIETDLLTDVAHSFTVTETQRDCAKPPPPPPPPKICDNADPAKLVVHLKSVQNCSDKLSKLNSNAEIKTLIGNLSTHGFGRKLKKRSKKQTKKSRKVSRKVSKKQTKRSKRSKKRN